MNHYSTSLTESVLPEPADGAGQRVSAALRRLLITFGGLIALGALSLLMAGNASAATDRGAGQDQVTSSTSGLVGSLVAPVTNTVGAVVAPVTNTAGAVVAPVAKSAAAVVAPVAKSVTPVTKAVAAVVAPVATTVHAAVAPVTRTVATVVGPVVKTADAVVAPVVATVHTVVAPVTRTVATVVAPVTRAVAPVTSAIAPVTDVVGSVTAPVVTAVGIAPTVPTAPSVAATPVAATPVAPHGTVAVRSVAQVVQPVTHSVPVRQATPGVVTVTMPRHSKGMAQADPAGAPVSPWAPANQVLGAAVGTASASSGGASGAGNAVSANQVIPSDTDARWARAPDASSAPQRWSPYDHNHPS
jgi:hypothetical protein